LQDGSRFLNPKLLHSFTNMKHFFAAFLLLPLLSFNAHKFYVSNTIIEYSAQNQSYGITVKMFTDDLENAIGGESIHLGEENEAINAGALVENYINAHFKLKFNDQDQMLSYIGKEVENDLTICYFEMMQSTDFHSLKIDNTILLELFPEQKNIVSLTVGGKSQTLIMTATHSSELVLH
jgi:hypothetical protein